MHNYKNIALSLVWIGFGLFLLLFFVGTYQLKPAHVASVIKDQANQELIDSKISKLYQKTYKFPAQLAGEYKAHIDQLNENFKQQEQWDQVIWTDYSLPLILQAYQGPIVQYPWLCILFSLGVMMLGALLFVFSTFGSKMAGIHHDKIFQKSISRGGWLGVILGSFLILFYMALYWQPVYLASWIVLLNPISKFFSGQPASQWFMYGFFYTIAVLVMGLRMQLKYKGNRYQQLRTSSVMFFQLIFAFLLPEILASFNQPWYDFKNIWPLDYDFFYAWNLNQLRSSGFMGIFILVWGLALIIVAIPIFTYFYGKRWYCSWVCGCGGLAETAGDPFRQLSNKSLKAWKIERWLINGVLVFAVVVTAFALVSYFNEHAFVKNYSASLQKWYGFFIGAAFSGVVGTGFYPLMGNRVWCRFGCPLAAILGIIQRFKSRFRITTNGGQCISCGNCSTYCEMGIDVRMYAQKGENIVRASCVGCGVCASVCPRGVLKLENNTEERFKTNKQT